MQNPKASKPGALRDAMPSTAAFIDQLRQAFGAEMIDGQIRKGIKGQADCFYAEEAGHTVGTPIKRCKSFEAPMPYRPEPKR